MDKDKLLARRYETGSGFAEETLEIPDIGTITVRGLSRGEAIAAQSANGLLGFEKFVLTYGVLDPKLTEQEVTQWQQVSSAGELTPIVDKIVELSGIGRSAARESYKSV